MKKCIFLCVFKDSNYINMLYILLQSLYTYGKISYDTDILVYTSTEYMNIIKKSHLYCENIKFENNDSYDDIYKACKSRLDLFNFPCIYKYDKILYLDIDIIIKGDINKIFNIIQEDKLYVLEEGTIDCEENQYWGTSLFKEEGKLSNYNDKSAFSSCIIGFNNCNTIKNLFTVIEKDMRERSDICGFYDQPFFVYNAFKHNLYNNKILKSYAVNSDTFIYSDKILHHFPVCPGSYYWKIKYMMDFFTKITEVSVQENIRICKEYINHYLLPIINNCGESLEGNIFMEHNSSNYTDKYIDKQKNISYLVLNKNIKHVMEIGFNAGFSTLLMLISNPDIKITCYDIGEHKYTLPCYQQIKKTFGNRIELVIGDSTKTLSESEKENSEFYDIIHIDGCHLEDIAKIDIINCSRFTKQGTILIMDDYDFPHIKEMWDSHCKNFNYIPLNIFIYENPYHDIKYALK